MTTLLPRLCLVLFACTAAAACEEEGPDGDTTEAATAAETGDSEATDGTGEVTAGVTMGSLAMPPDDSESGGESTTGGEDDPTSGPATTLAPPKLDNPE